MLRPARPICLESMFNLTDALSGLVADISRPFTFLRSKLQSAASKDQT